MPEETITKIDFSKSEQYTLSIRLSTDGFSFSIYNPILDHSINYLHYPVNADLPIAVNVKEMLSESDVFHHTYKKVNVLLVNKRFTLIPFELFEDEEGESFFYYNHPKQENEVILYNILRKGNIAIAFGMDKSVYQQLDRQYPDARFYSQASPLIEHFAGKCRLGNSKKMYAHLSPNSLDLFCYDRGRLLLANSFSCQQNEDRIYYLLYIWKQLGYNQERDELHLVGIIDDKEALIQKLKTFLKQVFIINPKAEFSHPALTKIEDIPFDLQTLLLCEL